MRHQRIVQLESGRWGIADGNGAHTSVFTWDKPFAPNYNFGEVDAPKITGVIDFATPEEATGHWRKYDLSHMRSGESNSASKCLESGEWTPHFVEVAHQHFYLKPEFHTPEIIEKHLPQYPIDYNVFTSY